MWCIDLEREGGYLVFFLAGCAIEVSYLPAGLGRDHLCLALLHRRVRLCPWLFLCLFLIVLAVSPLAARSGVVASELLELLEGDVRLFLQDGNPVG